MRHTLMHTLYGFREITATDITIFKMKRQSLAQKTGLLSLVLEN
jgi:hypothetical protein